MPNARFAAFVPFVVRYEPRDGAWGCLPEDIDQESKPMQGILLVHLAPTLAPYKSSWSEWNEMAY